MRRAAHGELAAVGSIGQAPGETREGANRGGGGHVPDPHGLVVAGRRDLPAVGAEDDGAAARAWPLKARTFRPVTASQRMTSPGPSGPVWPAVASCVPSGLKTTDAGLPEWAGIVSRLPTQAHEEVIPLPVAEVAPTPSE